MCTMNEHEAFEQWFDENNSIGELIPVAKEDAIKILYPAWQHQQKLIDSLEAKLLASQASEARLRGELMKIRELAYSCKQDVKDINIIYFISKQALSTPPNTAELEAHVEREIDKRFEVVASAWMNNGKMVNAFNHPPNENFDPDGYWKNKGYSKLPLYAKKG